MRFRVGENDLLKPTRPGGRRSKNDVVELDWFSDGRMRSLALIAT
jgi:hypothetical protein